MAEYSEQDLRYAAEFRDEIHKEALAKVRATYPDIDSVIDQYPVEAYFQQIWDYPGQWYTIVAIPEEAGSRAKLIDKIVKDTIENYKSIEEDQKPPKVEDGYSNQEARSRVIKDTDFEELIAKYPACVIDYCIVKCEELDRGKNAHLNALTCTCQELFEADTEEDSWKYDLGKAIAKEISPSELFTSEDKKGELSYRKAFLYPPHSNNYNTMDFNKINSVLFPNGIDNLEVYKWTTDWSDYFDDGHEWWGTLCLTIYDKALDRFVVVMASATD
jgi:hypothetical protein